MAPNDNFIQRAVNNGVATAGGYAGGVVDAAGKGVSGAGRNVGNRYAPTHLPYLPATYHQQLTSPAV